MSADKSTQHTPRGPVVSRYSCPPGMVGRMIEGFEALASTSPDPKVRKASAWHAAELRAEWERRQAKVQDGAK